MAKRISNQSEQASPASRARTRGRPKRDAAELGRDALIQAAKRVFATTEPARVNRTILAEAMGVDANLIRYYFGNMHNLVAEVIADNHAGLQTQMNAERGAFGPIDRLRHRIERTFRMFKENPNHHSMVRSTLYNDPGFGRYDEWVAILESTLADLTEIIDLGVKDGVMRKVTPSFLHVTIIAACEFWTTNRPVIELVTKPNAQEDKADEAYVAFLSDLILAGLARPAG
jgi:AcrR family transcriptional regulator